MDHFSRQRRLVLAADILHRVVLLLGPVPPPHRLLPGGRHDLLLSAADAVGLDSTEDEGH